MKLKPAGIILLPFLASFPELEIHHTLEPYPLEVHVLVFEACETCLDGKGRK